MSGLTRSDPPVGGVLSLLSRRYGERASAGRSRLYRFGSALTCSVNYSKLLGNHKYFFGLAREVVDPAHTYPPTDLGDFVLLVCGSPDRVFVLPRALILDAMKDVASRRLDIFIDDGSYILQTTKHPKIDVTQFLNAYPTYSRPSPPADENDDTEAPKDRRHAKVQWALIELGLAEGCSVWVPPGDRHLSYQRHRFDMLTLERLPHFGFDENTRRIVHNIDVLWLTRSVIMKAFEIESTTSIYSGLLRLNDLVLAAPNNRIELFIAARRSRRNNVRAQLMRPSFQPLLDRCQFLAFEHVEEQASRLADFPVDSGARVSGLIRGELFALPDHYMYPAGL